MRRRAFLRFLAGAAGLATAARSDRARASVAQPHVVVVGAGPAGLSAALELQERGVQVTLVEAAETVGGKVVGWTETLDGRAVDAEHGIHGWWPQYVHFRDLMARHDLLGSLRPWSPDDNGMQSPELVVRTFRDQAGAYVKAARERGYFNFTRNFRQGMRWVRGLPSSPEQLSALAGVPLSEWVASHPPMTISTTFDRMVAWSMYFRDPHEVDAAVAMEGEWFYWSGTPVADQVEWLRGNPQSLIFDPLADAFVGLGGTLRLGTPVASLVTEEGRVTGVRIGQATDVGRLDGPVQEWTRVGLALVGPGPTPEAPPVAYSARCTHMGCPVDVAADGFACPCHGGRYDRAGQPTAGPPERPLPRLHVVPDGDGFRLVDPTGVEELHADAVVLAVDVPALQALAGDLLPQARGLRATREVVARFWFDRDVDPTLRPAVLLDGYAHGSNGFLVHRLQDAARAWATRTGGSVIELQAYRDLPEQTGPPLLDTLEAEVRQIWPELADARRLHRTLTDGSTFTWFAPDWHAHALEVDPGVDGLLLAGDHVKTDRMVQFMERAVYTGRLAANRVLEAHGLQPAPILPFR